MKNFQKYIVKEDESLNYVSEKILSNNTRTVFVEKNSKISGVITEGDILRAIIDRKTLNANASDIMNKTFKFLNKKDNLLSKKMFKKFKITIIPILDKSMRLKDVVEPWDVM
jgi:predicted transcriptional regulator